MQQLGTIYLLHFITPYRHAAHYLGWTTDLGHRLDRHHAGTGARLIQVTNDAGIGWQLARIWEERTRADERKIKRAGGRARVCPICRPELRAAAQLADLAARFPAYAA